MREYRALLFSVAFFAALLLIAGLLGRRQRGVIGTEEPPSTFLTGPGGASGLYEALPRIGVRVSRLRGRSRELLAVGAPGRAAVMLLAPTRPVSSDEIGALLQHNASAANGGDLVLAGLTLDPLLACFGFDIRPFFIDSVPVPLPGRDSRRSFYAHAVLRRAAARRAEPESPFAGPAASCTPPAVARVDTVLTSARGPVMVEIRRADTGHRIILVADAALFDNRHIKTTPAGPFVLSFLAGRYDRVVFDEFHHGFGPSGSLGRTLLGWSVHSPWGWGVWQAAMIGVLALLSGAVRFGPPRTVIERKRRASLEHVRALATALAAARGHDVAISVLTQGLRRRLTPESRRRGEPAGQWLDSLERRTMAPKARDAVQTLKELTKPGQGEEAVLRAANAVEDVWDTLRHSAPTNWRR